MANIARTTEFLEGQDAFRIGRSEERCPYLTPLKRMAWLAGWANAKMNEEEPDLDPEKEPTQHFRVL